MRRAAAVAVIVGVLATASPAAALDRDEWKYGLCARLTGAATEHLRGDVADFVRWQRRVSCLPTYRAL